MTAAAVAVMATTVAVMVTVVAAAAADTYSRPGETVIAVFAGLHEPAPAEGGGIPHFPTGQHLHLGPPHTTPHGNTDTDRDSSKALHDGDLGAVAADGGVAEDAVACGVVSWRGVQQAAAAEWALQAINNQTEPQHAIGLHVVDTCGVPDVAARHMKALLQQMGERPLLGVVSVGSAAEAGALILMLSHTSIPLLVTSAEAAYDVSSAPTVFASTPHLETQMQAVVAAVGRLLRSSKQGGRPEGRRVGVVWSCRRAARALQAEASKADLALTLVREVTHSSLATHSAETDVPLHHQILHFALDHGLDGGDVVVLLLKVPEIHQLASGTTQRAGAAWGGEGSQPLRTLHLQWLLSSVEDDPMAHEVDILQVNEALPGVTVVGPHSPHLEALQQHLSDEVCQDHDSDANVTSSNSTESGGGGGPVVSPKSVLAPVLAEYCQLIRDQLTPATETLASPTPSLFPTQVDATHAASILRSISSLTAAYRIVQLQHCGASGHCTERVRDDLPRNMVLALQRLSYSVGDGPDLLRYTADARLFTTFSIVVVVRGELEQVGLYREGTGVEWADDFVIPVPTSGGRPPFRLSEPLVAHRPVNEVVHEVALEGSQWRVAAWSVAVCVVAAAGLVCCGCVAVCTVLKSCDGSGRNMQLPMVLVLVGTAGVLCGSVVVLLPLPAREGAAAALCCSQHVLPYVSLALAYAAMLTKAVRARLAAVMETRGQIPTAVLYLPLAALVALAVLLAALGDQTALHFLLPSEVFLGAATSSITVPTVADLRPANDSALPSGNRIVRLPNSAPHIISLRSADGSPPLHYAPSSSSGVSRQAWQGGGSGWRTAPAVAFETVQVCKRLDQIPAILGFAYLVLLLMGTVVLMATTTTAKSKPDEFYENRRVIVVSVVSAPLVLLWGVVSLHAPPSLQPPLTALALLLLAYSLLGLVLLPALRRMIRRDSKQFSHKPLPVPVTVPTVFAPYPVGTPPFTNPVVSYSSRGGGGEDGRFSDVIMCSDLIDKYKLRECSNKEQLHRWHRHDNCNNVAATYKIPRPNKLQQLQAVTTQCSCASDCSGDGSRK